MEMTEGFTISLSVEEQQKYFTRRERKTGKLSPERLQEVLSKVVPEFDLFLFIEASTGQSSGLYLSELLRKVAPAKAVLRDRLASDAPISTMSIKTAAAFLDMRKLDVQRLRALAVLSQPLPDKALYSADEVLALKDCHLEWDAAEYAAALRGDLKRGKCKIVHTAPKQPEQ